MGCGCKKKPKVPTIVVSTPEPSPIIIPLTIDQLHGKEMNDWNGGNIKVEETKEEN